MRKHVEVAESRHQETENLKAMLEDYKVKNAQLENATKSLQNQFSFRPDFATGSGNRVCHS